jgi:hypothetical protein
VWPSDERSLLWEAKNVNHEEFAHRAAGRLEEVADRTEENACTLGIDGEAPGTRARAREMRVAAFLVREEAQAVSEEESPAPGSPEALAEWPPLEAQA